MLLLSSLFSPVVLRNICGNTRFTLVSYIFLLLISSSKLNFFSSRNIFQCMLVTHCFFVFTNLATQPHWFFIIRRKSLSIRILIVEAFVLTTFSFLLLSWHLYCCLNHTFHVISWYLFPQLQFFVNFLFLFYLGHPLSFSNDSRNIRRCDIFDNFFFIFHISLLFSLRFTYSFLHNVWYVWAGNRPSFYILIFDLFLLVCLWNPFTFFNKVCNVWFDNWFVFWTWLYLQPHRINHTFFRLPLTLFSNAHSLELLEYLQIHVTNLTNKNKMLNYTFYISYIYKAPVLFRNKIILHTRLGL